MSFSFTFTCCVRARSRTYLVFVPVSIQSNTLTLHSKMDNLSSARAEVRHAAEVLRGYKIRRCAGISLTKWCELTTLCIVAMADYNFKLGVQWLLSKKRQGAVIPATVTATQLQAHLEDAFLRWPVDQLMSWIDPAASTLPLNVIKTALAFTQGHTLASWVAQ